MQPVPDLSWSHLAQFIRQHTHDIRNDLSGLDLEAGLLAEIVADADAAEGVVRIRAQIRRLAGNLRTVSAKFAEPKPDLEFYAARELFHIWKDQLHALHPAPTVDWKDTLGAERVKVDATALAAVFHELLANAQSFGTGAPIFAEARVADRSIVFELREPKGAPMETASWGRAPFASMRHGHYGLGLWEVQRTIAANGGEIIRRFALDSMELISALRFPVA